MVAWMLTTMAGCAAAPEARLPDGFWDHWGDGRAELSGYTLTIPRYGELRRGSAVAIYVTEPFTRATRVKSDGGHDDAFPVLKLNLVQDFQTGIYDYNVLTSTFVPLDQSLPPGLPTKVALGVQEWCGTVHEQLIAHDGAMAWTSHSYFDGEADQQEQIPTPSTPLSADAMFIAVRGLQGELVEPGGRREVDWLPRLLTGRLAHTDPTWTRATITRSAGISSVTVPAGTFEVFVWTAAPRRGPTWTWQVEAAWPHRIVRWTTSDGEEAELTGSFRDPYWQHHRNGDEALREKLGL